MQKKMATGKKDVAKKAAPVKELGIVTDLKKEIECMKVTITKLYEERTRLQLELAEANAKKNKYKKKLRKAGL